MSRSGYSDYCDYLFLYRTTVRNALNGKRGQHFLKELGRALDALPEKRLILGELIDSKGEVCAIGSVCKSRSIDVSKIDYEDPESVGRHLGVATCVAAEIAYMNDEDAMTTETPEQRWTRMREWVAKHILPKETMTSKDSSV